MAVLGLRFCARAFSSCGKRGPLFITVRGPLTIAASLVAEHRLQTHRLSNYGSRAQPLRGMWDPPRPGLEPVSPALAGGLSTTAPPRKPWNFILSGVMHRLVLPSIKCPLVHATYVPTPPDELLLSPESGSTFLLSIVTRCIVSISYSYILLINSECLLFS